jgi:hypothetical protein
MKVDKYNKRDTRFPPWTALCVLSLLAAMVFAVPSVVFAQTYELSQDCETALVGTEHTITAKVTDGDVPVEGVLLMFMVQGVNSGFYPPIATGQDGTAEFTYPGGTTGTTNIWLTVIPNPNVLATIQTEWTEEDLCSKSKSADVTVGARVTLNAKKRGALRIAVCAVDGHEVNNVDLENVQLVGVAPFRSKQKDSRLCPDGKDGVLDLVLKFKNRDVIKALEEVRGEELEDGDPVDLALTGSLNDGTTFEHVWQATIKKKGKRHWKKKHHQKKDKKHKKDKGSKK